MNKKLTGIFAMCALLLTGCQGAKESSKEITPPDTGWGKTVDEVLADWNLDQPNTKKAAKKLRLKKKLLMKARLKKPKLKRPLPSNLHLKRIRKPLNRTRYQRFCVSRGSKN